MTVINTNVGALTARTYAVKANESMQKAMERLSSGLRINSAADDAAGLAVANKMESQLRGMNVAIRNSQDGISLVQTAEAGMGEITNMIIRMRELSVQMNNGVYTDSDRTNAQLEVTALLAEIDKIASNTAFNNVKVLDGSYSKGLRAGNTNVEVINVGIQRMNTDSLGGNVVSSTSSSVATATDQTATSNTQSAIVATAQESTKVELKPTALSTEMQAFATANAGGTYTITGTNAALFQVDSNDSVVSRAAINYDATGTNSYTFDVTYTATNSATYKDTVTLNITENTDAAVVKAATTALSAAEAPSMTFKVVNSTGNTDGLGSDELQTFVGANTAGATNGGWSVGGADASLVSIDANGVVTVTGGTDFETKASYSFKAVFTTNTGDQFEETINLSVTDLAEEYATIATPTVPTSVKSGDAFTVTAAGTAVTATLTANDNAFTITKLANALNAQITTLNTATPGTVQGSFSVASNGTDLVYTFGPEGNLDNTVAAGQVSAASQNKAEYTLSSAAETTAGVTGVAVVIDHSLAGSDAAGVASGDTITLTDGTTTLSYALGSNDTWASGDGDGALAVVLLAGFQAHANYAGAGFTLALNSAGTGFTFTNKTSGTFTTANLVTANSTNAGNIAGANTVSTAGVAEVNEVQTINVAATTLGYASAAAGDVYTVTVDGTDISATLSGAQATAVAAAGSQAAAVTLIAGYLETAGTAAGLAWTFSDNAGDIVLTADAGGGAQTPTISGLKVNETDKNLAGQVAPAYTNGVAVALTAATNAAGRANSTAKVTTNQLAGDYASRSSTEIIKATSTIALEEAASVKFDKVALSAGFNTFVGATAHAGGKYTLGGTDAASFSIDSNGVVKNEGLMDYETKNSFAVDVIYTDVDGNKFIESVTLNLTDSTADSGTHLIDVDVSTQAGSATAVTILDKALDQISASQAELGAIQNRLQHNIDNLSMGSMLTETARGRIMDADFARETSELSKQQILGQAATSMLAQANQSKQSVLALLQ